jgi:hydrogenase maturation protein HypF
MGRLFDAVSALLGVRKRTSYEAQAAIELEMAAGKELGIEESGIGELGNWGIGQLGGYPDRNPATWQLHAWRPYLSGIETDEDKYVVRLRELLAGLVSDLQAGAPLDEMALRFHQTVAQITVEVCERIARDTGLRTVALSGGCFQNRLLLALTLPALRQAGFQVLHHRQVPCNDGGLSLGQAAIAHFAAQKT